MKKISIFLIIFLLSISQSCGKETSVQSTALLDMYFQSEGAGAVVKLPKKLNEISGLAVSPDGRLFAHNDENGIVYQLNYADGKIIKNFYIGKKTVHEDFEGLAIVNESFFLVTSRGTLYKFKEGKNGRRVSYKKFKTFLSAKNDVEGLCYDPAANSLLLACKGSPGKGYKGHKAVYSFSLKKMKLDKKPRFVLSEKKILSGLKTDAASKMAEILLLKENSFSPSGIERHPVSGSFFIIGAKGTKMIIEVSDSGRILSKRMLNPKMHQQPEGITFLNNGTMLIADESVDKKAAVTPYTPIKK